MWRRAFVGVAAVLALAACGTSGGGEAGTDGAMQTASARPGTTTAAAPTGGPATAREATASASAEATAQGVAVAADPCTVVTQSEAAALSGMDVQPGQTTATGEGGKVCTYVSATGGAVSVIVAQATNAADADAVWDEQEARAKDSFGKALPEGVDFDWSLDDVTGLGDHAAIGTGTATIASVTISGTDVFVLRGTQFLAISSFAMGGTAPSADVMEAAARTALGRL